jgi:hypothetical protein
MYRTGLAIALLAACATTAERTSREGMNALAEDYVKLVLALGVHSADDVDAYYGPPAWREEALRARAPLAELGARADRLSARLDAIEPGAEELDRLRHGYLTAQVRAVRTRIDLLSGKRLSFDEEARALYGIAPAAVSEAELKAAVADLDRLLPGDGPVSARLGAFRDRFTIPPERLPRAIDAALAECRARTLRHLALPPGEQFTVEYVTGQPWGAYNWYQGGLRSLIQVNTDLPMSVDRVLEICCHEGYPGHHAYNLLLESRLVRGRGFVELTVYPLFSPQSLIAEGSANLGVALAFPGEARGAWEREVLWPLAGLDPAEAPRYEAVRAAQKRLRYAGIEAARRFVDGALDAAGTARWLEENAAMPPDRARQQVRFMARYRSYVVNYTLGEDVVSAWIVRQAADEAGRWRAFEQLLSTPRLPQDLVEPRG